MQASPASFRRLRRISVALALLAAPAAAQVSRNPQEPRNLLANGGFENPPVAPGTSSSLSSAGPWSALAGSLRIQNRAGASVPFEGDQHLELGGATVARQASATRPGFDYALSLAYCPRPEAGDVAFELWFAGALLETVFVPAGSAAVWQHRSHLVTGASLADAVELRALGGAPVGVLVDDVFLMPYDAASTAQLLRNPNFEEDPHLEPDTSMANAVFVGWFSLQDRTIEVRDLGTAGNGANGKNVVDLDEGLGIGQRVFVVPDRSYTLRFASSPNPADDRERRFQVSFAGQVLDTITFPGAAPIAWTTRSYTVRSEAPLARLEFQDLSGGLEGALIDAVGLSGIVPEPETAGQVRSHRVLANTPTANLRLRTDDMFARGATGIGDLDGDGMLDLAIGAVGDDDGADKAGAVWIVFLNRDRSVRSARKISELAGGLVADLQPEDGFGRALAGLGDLDGDGVPDLAVGANEDDTGGSNAGAVYVLFLNRDGSVKGQHKISALSGDALDFFPRTRSEFGASIAGMGDVDGDGIPDVAIGARFSNSVQTCFLNRDGTVKSALNVTYGRNGFTDRATSFVDLLGMSVANMGDFDGDGVNDLLVGAFGREFAGQDFVGGQYLWLMERTGRVKRWFYYGSENMNPRSQTLGLHYDLGTACAGPGDVDGNGVLDILSGAQREGWVSGFDREEGAKDGAVYVLLLNANGTIKTCQRLADRVGGFDYAMPDGARWGESLCALGDTDGNGLVEVAIGSRFVLFTGAAFLCEMQGELEVPPPPPLRADFLASPLGGAAPLLVRFTDRSSGSVASWTWDFGDGSGASVPSPSHTYAAPGTYSVSLTVGDGLGATDTRTAAGLVSVSAGGGLPVGVAPTGCGVNPPGSFRWLSGSPRVGTSMVFGVDNPLGTQAVGSTPRVLGSWTAPANLPCGVLVAGQGMSAPGASGERLIGTTLALNRAGSAWQGAGNPAPVTVSVPANASLIGRTLYVQGRIVDALGAPIRIGLADGFALTLQP
jgi:PKD repeat protein